jgi:phage/plasmid-associated DNA primase
MYNLFKNNRINIAVDHILNDYCFFSTSQQYENADNFYYYDNANGLYVLDAEMFILDKLNEIFPNQFKHFSHIRDVINNIQRFSPIIPDNQIDPPHLVNFRNGILDKSLNKLLPHSPRFYTTKQIPQNHLIETDSLSKYSKRLALLNAID